MAMDNQKEKHSNNSEKNDSTLFSQRLKLLKETARIFNKDLEKEDLEVWKTFLNKFCVAELRYAFEKWNENGESFPKPVNIGILCEQYRLGEAQKLRPIGCERCEWTGFYTVTRNGIERVVAECPCRNDPSLRTKDTRQMASMEEMRWMWTEVKRISAEKDMNKIITKPKQISGDIPTSMELAEQLTKNKHWHLLGGKDE